MKSSTPPAYKNDRVGLYLNPHTRNRLNKLKAALTLETGQVHSQDDVVVKLLDHYAATNKQMALMRELA